MQRDDGTGMEDDLRQGADDREMEGLSAEETGATGDDGKSTSREMPDLDAAYRRELLGEMLPSAQQVATALAAAALVSPAALGGMPVLPVTLDDQRRRQQEEIQQESESSVGAYRSVVEAATALTFSQRRLAAVTREVQGTHKHDVTESDVVSAARKVAHGETSETQRHAFRSALGRVALDSVDLFILLDDERRERAEEERLASVLADGDDDRDEDDDWDDWDEGDDWE